MIDVRYVRESKDDVIDDILYIWGKFNLLHGGMEHQSW